LLKGATLKSPNAIFRPRMIAFGAMPIGPELLPGAPMTPDVVMP